MKAKFYIVFLFFFYSTLGLCQLNDFTITTVVTNEVCQNKGGILISVQNETVGASLVYKVYKLPNTTIPVSGLANSTSLSAGDYKVEVTQTLGNETLTKEASVTILNQIVDLSFSLAQNATSSCGVSGSIVVTVLTGSATIYELYQSNQLLTSQSTNEFPNLVAGLYKVRVIDNCGYGVPQDYNLILTPSNLSISTATNPLIATSCNNISVINNITPTPGTNLVYPITVVYTIHPPNNAPDIISNQVFITGLPDILILSKDFPVNNDSYSFDLSITDNCQINAVSLANPIDPNPKVILSENISKCGKFLTVSASNFLLNYTISFINSPIGFSPNTFNTAHPGPFSNPSTDYGDQTHEVPFGIYQVKIVDGCGREAFSDPFEVLDIALVPTKSAKNAGCDALFGSIFVSLPENRKIVFAQIITNAPAEFQLLHALPYDVTSNINSNGALELTNLPLGLYHIEFIDQCGVSYAVNLLVPPFVKKPFVASALPNCDSGTGSVNISTENGAVTKVLITSAPPAFLIQHTLPFDVSSNILAGIFYMNNLNEGIYEFKCRDICGFEDVISKQIDGYNRSQSGTGYTVTRNCGSYNIALSDTSNATSSQTFWLQKQNPTTLAWQHPTTGVVYDETTIPSNINSISLNNNVTLYNLTQIGIFRVIKIFKTFNDGRLGSATKNCKEILGEFEFTNGLKIKGAYSLDCPGGSGSSAVVLDAEGVAPYNFSILFKNDLPFVFDNGNSNTFANLPPGKYEFLVEDFCSATKTSTYTVGNLPKLAQAFVPSDMKVCRYDSVQAGVLDLTTQNNSILGQQPVNSYSVHYYLTQDDADNDVNRINNDSSFLTTQNPQTIFARVNHKTILSCYDTTSFLIYIGKIPTLNPSLPIFICAGIPMKIHADVNNFYDSYEWSTGEKTFGITINQPGAYTVIARNEYGLLNCESLPKSIIVDKSEKPIFDRFEIIDWTVEDNSITVFVGGSGSYLYSLDGINYQADKVFSGLKPDLYKVYIKDDNGCGEIDKNVVLMNYEKFFTPNGDGINDKWQIKFSKQEPNLSVEIYDRYGKLITVLNASNDDWDGTYNGELLPSSDYWFVVNRQDGKVYKGHFSVKR